MGNSSKAGFAIAVLVVAGLAFALLMMFDREDGGAPPPEVVPAPSPALDDTEPADDAEPALPAEPEPPEEPAEVPTGAPAPEKPPKSARSTAPDRDPPLQAVLTVKDTVPPPLSVLAPLDRSYVTSEQITLQAKSEAGARVDAGGSPLLETSPGLFEARLTLRAGLNQVRVRARDAVGNTSAAMVRVTFVDPARYNQFKDRLGRLLEQLEEIQQASNEIDLRTKEIIREISSSDDADRVNRLSREQASIRNARRELQKEIESAILEINTILAKKP